MSSQPRWSPVGRARSLCVRSAVSIALCGALSAAQAQQPAPGSVSALSSQSPEDLARGKRLFEAQCSRCHGFDGTGGLGPTLRTARLRRAPDDSALLNVIRFGVVGTAMAGSFWLTDTEAVQVGAYVRTLGHLPVTPLSGDSARGAAVFATKGGCSACHILAGKGDAIGPDLTDIGARRGVAYLQASLETPGAELPRIPLVYEPGSMAGYLPVHVVTRNGRVVDGIRVNEDAFTIQIRDPGGHVQSFRKATLQHLEHRFGTSLMPSYRGKLLPGELEDLLAYLASLRGEP
jgi:cytochrome c oxidase cbb3-type subunit III